MDGRTRTQSMLGNPRGYHQKSIGSPIFDPYSENRDLNSPILRYYSSHSPSSSSTVVVSPLSAVENLMGRSPSSSKVYGTPVRAMEGEEVLVMDGVLVSGGGRSTRSCASGSSSSSGSSGKSRYKREICRSWKDSGHCRHGSKCQFAHGKEELRPNRLTVKSKTEVMVPVVVKAAQPITKTASPIAPKNISKILTTSITYREWSPQDDGIEVSLPCLSTGKPPGRKEVTAYIDKILSCPTTRRRLPIFAEIFRA